MLIQPHLENAIWHGLRYRETKGLLLLKFELNSIIPELHSLFLQLYGNCKFYLPQECGENLKSLL